MTGKEGPRKRSEHEGQGANSSHRKRRSPRGLSSGEKFELIDYLMPLTTKNTVVKDYWNLSEELAIGNNYKEN